MPPHFGHTPSVVQLGYAPDYSRVTAQYGTTPSYVPTAPTPHVHGLTCSTHLCTDQTVGFETPPTPLVYFAPYVHPLSTSTSTPPAPIGHFYAQ